MQADKKEAPEPGNNSEAKQMETSDINIREEEIDFTPLSEDFESDELTCFNPNEVSDVDLVLEFVKRAEGLAFIKYDQGFIEWLHYDGKRWITPSENGNSVKPVTICCNIVASIRNDLRRQAFSEPEKDDQGKLLQTAKRLGSQSGIDAFLKCVANHTPSLQIDPRELDSPRRQSIY